MQKCQQNRNVDLDSPLEEGAILTLADMAEQLKERRVERTKAVLSDGFIDTYGWRLSAEEVEKRAQLLRYKNIGPIWIAKKHTNKWTRFKRCLDFNSPDLHMRCVDDNNDLHVFDPEEVNIESSSERLLRIAKYQLEELEKAQAALTQEISYLGRRVEILLHRQKGINQKAERVKEMVTRSATEESRERRRNDLRNFMKGR